MNSQAIFPTAQKIIAEALRQDPASIQLEKTIRGDLAADSMDSLEVVLAIEEAFAISFDEKAILDINTIGDLIKQIEVRLSVQEPVKA